MNLFSTSAQLTESLPKDEHIFRHVLNGWDIDLAHFLQVGIPQLLFALLASFICQQIVLFFVRRMRQRADHLVGNSSRASQLRTVAAILRATAYAIIGFYLLTQVLGAIGVSLGPFIASAGVIGLGISFGAQSIFKDMLTGIFILVEDQYSVGDTITIAGLTGIVEDLSLRITRLRGSDGTIYIVPNSQITTVSNLSRDFAVGTLNISVDAREDPTRVIALLKKLADDVRNDAAFKDIVIADPTVPGVDSLKGYEAIYPITVRVRVNQRDGVMRELRKRVLAAFAMQSIPLGATNSTVLIQPPAVLPQSSATPDTL
ncbi:mechanosensitive ion channel [Granulicella sp. 5B5]|nr:mechanosensitive ion channel [Granulicella sp. 5B5]